MGHTPVFIDVTDRAAENDSADAVLRLREENVFPSQDTHVVIRHAECIAK